MVIPHPDPYPHGFPPTPLAMRDRTRVGRRPILIAGGKGTLATAFGRICAARGLSYELLSRSELDIADEVSVDAVFERFQPWAMVNAAGYVSVDEAELDQDRCRRENTTGAQRLAEASRRRGVRLLCFCPTWSSTDAPGVVTARTTGWHRCRHTVGARPTRRPRYGCLPSRADRQNQCVFRSMGPGQCRPSRRQRVRRRPSVAGAEQSAGVADLRP